MGRCYLLPHSRVRYSLDKSLHFYDIRRVRAERRRLLHQAIRDIEKPFRLLVGHRLAHFAGISFIERGTRGLGECGHALHIRFRETIILFQNARAVSNSSQ